MPANHREHIRELVRNLKGSMAGFGVSGNGNNSVDACGTCPFDYLWKFMSKIRISQVGVCIIKDRHSELLWSPRQANATPDKILLQMNLRLVIGLAVR